MAEDNVALLKWQTDLFHIRELVNQQGWDVYQGYVDRVVDEQVEHLLQMPPGLTPGTVDYYRGVIAGLRRAKDLAGELIRNDQSRPRSD